MKNKLFLGIIAFIAAGFLYSNISNTNQKVDQRNEKTISKETKENKEVKTNFLLEINSPKDKATVSTTVIKVEGKANPSAEIFINEKETKADSTGNFSIEYELFEGENEIYISANDSSGNYVEKVITVYLETTE